MENIKKRKSEDNYINMDPDILQNIIHNQEKMISYIYQIGTISENTFNTLGNIEQKMKDLNNIITNLEVKNVYLENSINKINNSFIQELKNKDLEIQGLKELNKNIIEDYNYLIETKNQNNVNQNNINQNNINQNNINQNKDNSSFYL